MKLIRHDGFTLIELMIVIAIIGILAAIAIPQFAAYRARSFNASAIADIRNATTAQEAYYAEHRVYANSVNNLQGSYDLAISKNVDLDTVGSTTRYTITSYHPSGDKTYTISGPDGVITGN